jgi:hypothetical protein
MQDPESDTLRLSFIVALDCCGFCEATIRCLSDPDRPAVSARYSICLEQKGFGELDHAAYGGRKNV